MLNLNKFMTHLDMYLGEIKRFFEKEGLEHDIGINREV